MKRMKMIITAMLAAALCLTGCNAGGGSTSSSVKSAASSSAASGTPYSEAAETESSGNAYITGDNVKFRTGPGTENDVIDSLKKGTEVKLISRDKEKKGWSKVRIGDEIGYVSNDFVSATRPEPSSVSEEKPSQQQASSSQAAASQAVPPSGNGNTGSGKIVCIDPGHQAKANSAQEPIGPGASETKAKVTGGTSGVATGLTEYELTLQVSLKLQAELQARGYTVIMTRTSHNVDISNSERAAIANNAGAGAFIRIHANGSTNASTNGALTMCQTASNPYNGRLHGASYELSKAVLNGLCSATGCANKGVSQTDKMSGINWCNVPVTIVEMGFMSNPQEDRNMADPAYQNKMAAGMADGIDAYFGR